MLGTQLFALLLALVINLIDESNIEILTVGGWIVQLLGLGSSRNRRIGFCGPNYSPIQVGDCDLG